MKKLHYLKIFVLSFAVLLQINCKNNRKNNVSQTDNTATQQNVTKNDNSDDEIYYFPYQGKKYVYLIRDQKAEITDTTGKVIIPQKFDFIVYPGETYPGMVEVCKNGKYGLYSFPEGKEILSPEYDAFYPVFDNRILAYYRKGNSYGYVKKNQSASDAGLEIYKKSPFQNKTIEKWKFTIPTEPYKNDDEWSAVSFTPSFMNYFLSEHRWDGEAFDGGIHYNTFLFSVIGNLNDGKKKYLIAEIYDDVSPP